MDRISCPGLDGVTGVVGSFETGPVIGSGFLRLTGVDPIAE